MSLDQVTDVAAEALLSQVSMKQQQGCRFVTMTCLCAGDGHDVLYHFDKDYQLSSLRLHVAAGQDVPSITGLFLAAVLAENEIKDMFGLSIQGLAIDFKGRLLLTDDAPKTPLDKKCGIGLDVRTKPQPGKGESA
jgi:ech hydrogenase subunit D